MNFIKWKIIVGAMLLWSFTVVAERVRVTPPSWQGVKQPRIAVADDGTILIVFGKDNALFSTTSVDRGQTFTLPVKISELDQLAIGMRRGPRIAVSQKQVVVTAISHKSGNLYSWASDIRANSWSEPKTINSEPGSAREGMQGLASSSSGDLFAVWLDLRNKKTELWGAKSTDHGQTWERNVQVYKSPDGTICECCHPSVKFTPKGDIVVMWRNWLNGSRDMYQSVSTDGGKTFASAGKLGSGTWRLQACPMDGGDLATASGKTAQVWRRQQQLFLTTASAEETLLTPTGTHPIIVGTPTGFATGWQHEGKVYWKVKVSAPATELGNGGYLDALFDGQQKQTLTVWEGTDGIYFSPIKNP